MRGMERTGGSLFSHVDLEARVPARHPLRAMRDLADASLAALDSAFRPLYSLAGRPSIPPGQVLRATLPQLLYTIRSERQLLERMQYDLLFRWFVGLGIDAPVFVPTVFSKNCDLLLTADIAQKFLAALLAQPQAAKLSGAEHFSIDGTMPEAFASIKSFRAKDGADKPPDATASAISSGKSFRTTPMPPRPTPMRGCVARAAGRRASRPIRATP